MAKKLWRNRQARDEDFALFEQLVGDELKCKDCGATILLVRHKTGHIQIYNPDGTTHWFTCPALRKFQPNMEVRELTDDDLHHFLEIAQARAALIGQLKQALVAGDVAEALRLARKVCGLPEATS